MKAIKRDQKRVVTLLSLPRHTKKVALQNLEELEKKCFLF